MSDKNMNSNRNKAAFTIVEMLVVIAIVAILTAMVVGIAGRVDNQGKQRFMVNTLSLIDAALNQFSEYGFDYKDDDYID